MLCDEDATGRERDREITRLRDMVSPVPPMSTSGEMVERLRAWSIDDIQDTPRSTLSLIDEAASRIEALEALVAEQAGEIEKLRHIRDRRGDKIIELSERALSAEAALAKGGG